MQADVVPDSVKEYDYCVYDSDVSTGYGVGALLFLFASQVLVMAASSCFCCGKALRPGGSRAWAIILFILCWVTFLIAEACLLAGSVRNAYHTKYRGILYGDPLSCQTVRKGVFAAGAAFVFFTALLSEIYYVCYASARDKVQSNYEASIGMGAHK